MQCLGVVNGLDDGLVLADGAAAGAEVDRVGAGVLDMALLARVRRARVVVETRMVVKRILI